MGMYSDLFTDIDTNSTSYISDTATNIISAITPVTQTMLIIYVVLWGLLMMKGTISEPITDGLGRILKISIITGLVLSIGNYNGYISDFLWNTPNALSAVIAGDSSATSINFLDTLMEKFMGTSAKYLQNAELEKSFGIPDLTLFFCGIIIFITGVVVTAYAAFLLALSKVALAIILAIGPIFVLLTMFEATKKFFDAWIGQALNFVFLSILTAATITFLVKVIESKLILIDAEAGAGYAHTLPIMAYSAVATLVMMQLPSIASALGGGVAISTLGSVSWAYDKGKNAARTTAKAAYKTPAAYRKIRDKYSNNSIKQK